MDSGISLSDTRKWAFSLGTKVLSIVTGKRNREKRGSEWDLVIDYLKRRDRH